MGRLRTRPVLGLRSAAAALVLLGLGACSPNRVFGQVDSLEIPVRSGFFFEQPNALGADSLVGIVLTDLPDGCDDYGFYAAASENLSTPAEYTSAWAAVFPAGFWETALVLRTADPSVSLSGQRYKGVAANRTLTEQGQTYGRITHNKALRDDAWFDGSAPETDYFDEYITVDGNLEIDLHRPQQLIKGTMGASTANTKTGNPSGLLVIHFKATFCPNGDLL